MIYLAVAVVTGLLSVVVVGLIIRDWVKNRPLSEEEINAWVDRVKTGKYITPAQFRQEQRSQREEDSHEDL
jgi:hypothetical protein